MRARTILIIAALGALGAAPAGAAAQSSTAIDVVMAAANPDDCHATVDRSTAQLSVTPFERVTPIRPAGYDVALRGVSERNASSAAFTSQWYVTGGRAFPRNIAAARLAVGCRATTFAPSNTYNYHRLDYLDPDTGVIGVYSNEGWLGAARVRAFDPTTRQNQLDSEESMAVWSPSCSAGRQTARFTRALYLLGDPQELSIDVQGYVKGLRVWPFASITARVNGQVVGRRATPGTLEVQLSPAALHSIDTTATQIEVTVVKKKTGACNGTSRRKLAVFIGVLGKQAWDIRTTRPAAQTTNNGSLPTVPFTITNYGPSVLLEPRFFFSVAYDQEVEAINPRVVDDDRCMTVALRSAVSCGLGPLRGGDAVTLPVQFYARPKNRPDGDNYLLRFTETWEGWWARGGIFGGSFCSGSKCTGAGGA